MVVAFQGVALGEEELCGLLETQPAGIYGIQRVAPLSACARCHAEVTSASFDDLARWLQEGVPPIVFVSTGPLPYWQTECLHALVVVEVGEQTVLVHDPAFPTAPIAIPRDEFLAAWGALAQLTALVRVSA